MNACHCHYGTWDENKYYSLLNRSNTVYIQGLSFKLVTTRQIHHMFAVVSLISSSEMVCAVVEGTHNKKAT